LFGGRAHPLEELAALLSWILGSRGSQKKRKGKEGKGEREMEERKKEKGWENRVSSPKWHSRKI